MSSDYLEAIVILKPNANIAQVRTWFESRGFNTMPMQAGMLVTGNSSLVAQAFGVGEGVVPVHGAERSLPIPAELQDHVDSIVIPGLRSIH